MLTSIRIQNFRSIRDASVKLGQVNLFIGPNNSGKSNFLKGIEDTAKHVVAFPNNQGIPFEWYEQIIPRGSKPDPFQPLPIIIQLDEQLEKDKICEIINSIQGIYGIINREVKINLKATLKSKVFGLPAIAELDLNGVKPDFLAFPQPFYAARIRLENCIVYKLEPATFQTSAGLSNQPFLQADGSNIANFINTLRQNHEGIFNQLKQDFAKCIGDLISISTPPDPFLQGNLKIKFFDKSSNSYWAEEVSEGVLYFLALLCIVHQPDPPKLLLLEEPEKGIHPRRIKEVMDFIFELAQLRDIQIILTSHSPYVVDHFADIPECISVFDRENGETVVRNAADIIEETNSKLNKPIRYSDALGEHWVSGFLGGVPV